MPGVPSKTFETLWPNTGHLAMQKKDGGNLSHIYIYKWIGVYSWENDLQLVDFPLRRLTTQRVSDSTTMIEH